MSSAAPGSRMLDLNERPIGRIQRGLAQLLGVHFPQPFEARDVQAFFACGPNGGQEAAQVFQPVFRIASPQHVARRAPRRCGPAESATECRIPTRPIRSTRN